VVTVDIPPETPDTLKVVPAGDIETTFCNERSELKVDTPIVE